MTKHINTIELFRSTGGAIARNNAINSDPIDLRALDLEGSFSLHMIHAGGTITATVLVCSTPGGTYVAPSTPVTILLTKAAGSYFASFSPPVAPFMKIRFTETNVAAVTTMDAWLNLH